jgi:hypothetical protein
MHTRRLHVGILLTAIILLASVVATGQSQLVPLVTDKTPLALSTRFGITTSEAINQGGNLVFSGSVGSALFLQRAGERIRVMQMGDEVPGYPGSQADVIQSPLINTAGLVAFRVDISLADGLTERALFTWNDGTLRKIVAGQDFVPDSSTVRYQRGITLVGLSSAGDLAFVAPLVENGSPLPAQTTLFIARADGTVVRVAGLGDSAPGAGGRQFQSLATVACNSAGEVLFSANLGGSVSGLFVGRATGVRKVVATGDALPSPFSGSFNSPGTALLNNNGDVAFVSTSSTAPQVAIWMAAASGTVSQLVSQGTLAPAVPGGRFGNLTLRAFNNAGMVAFNCPINSSTTTNHGLFRYNGGTVETVAYAREQATEWTPDWYDVSFYFSDSFSAVSMNQGGDIAFRVQTWNTPTGGWDRRNALYRQRPGEARTLIAYDGQPTPLPGGGDYALTFSTYTVVLDDGRVWFYSDVVGGEADFGQFLVSGSDTQVLMTTADPLPADARVVLRTFRPGASGDYVGFTALRAGGGLSVGVHQLSTLTTKVVFTDGEVVEPGTRIRVGTRNAVFLNNAGTVAIVARVLDAWPGPSFNVIGIRRWNGETTGVVAPDSPAPGTGSGPGNEMRFTDIQMSTMGPSPLNDAEQVVFVGSVRAYNSTMNFTGIWVGSPTDDPVKVALNTETVPGGAGNFGNFNALLNGISLNQAGQVAFLANTNLGGTTLPAIYLWSPGSGIAEIVRTAPSGFSNLGYPSFNNNGDLAFVAAGGAIPGGVFLSQSGGAPVAVAQHGLAAPGGTGGSFSFTAARADVVVNDRGDVVFRSDLSGGTSDSGFFLRRPAGAVQAVVLQGQTAPGLAAPFASVTTGPNNAVGEIIQLGPDGDVALTHAVVVDAVRRPGIWHVTTADALEEILVRGTLAPAFGGGAAVANTVGLGWNGGSRFPLWARVSGGTFADGIFLSVPHVPTPTPPGNDVPVRPTDQTTGTTPVSLTFDTVTGAGDTTVTTSAAGPSTPSAFTLGDPPIFYDIATTAAFSGAIEVCIDVSSVGFPPGGATRLLHFESGAWVDVTTSATAAQVCGSVTSLSPFTVAKLPDLTFEVAATPAVIWPPNNKMVTITADITVDQPGAPTPRVELVSITSNEVLGPGDVQGAVFGTDCRTFKLRATRRGNGGGRTYTITYRAIDFVGTVTLRTVTVVVPHDHSGW